MKKRPLNKFVWAKYPVPDDPKRTLVIGHVIEQGEDLTYCQANKTTLPNRTYTHGIPENDPQTISRSLCMQCQRENKKRLAQYYGIKDWA